MSGYAADHVETRFVTVGDVRYAYRRTGPQGDVPLLLANRFRGTMDHWDPALLDVLAERRDVVVFDNAGVSLSSGAAAPTIEGMAATLAEFAEAVGLTRYDLLGWSMGGMVAQSVALQRPASVRRLVVAGSGPGRVPGTPPRPAAAAEVSGRAVNTAEDFLYLFFPDTPRARALGRQSLMRLQTRLDTSHATVGPAAVAAQQAATQRWHGDRGGTWEHLDRLELPVLVANGAHDVVVPAYQSYAMSQRLPQAKVVLYSDAGHAFLFQHAADVGSTILDFLEAPDEPTLPHTHPTRSTP